MTNTCYSPGNKVLSREHRACETSAAFLLKLYCLHGSRREPVLLLGPRRRRGCGDGQRLREARVPAGRTCVAWTSVRASRAPQLSARAGASVLRAGARSGPEKTPPKAPNCSLHPGDGRGGKAGDLQAAEVRRGPWGRFPGLEAAISVVRRKARTPSQETKMRSRSTCKPKACFLQTFFFFLVAVSCPPPPLMNQTEKRRCFAAGR